MRIHHIKTVLRLALLSLIVGGLALGAVAASAANQASGAVAATHGKVVGRVYTETNGAIHNQILIFNRFADGTLKQIGAKSTGGAGGLQPEPGCPGNCPFLDTEAELALTPGGHLLFAVNAGSNQITSFRATPSGLKRISVVRSGGVFPNSLTIHGNLLYVLNANSDNIAGFRFTANGKLKPIAGSSRPLVGGARPGLPRQIGFDPSGRVLMVTLLATQGMNPFPTGGTSHMIDTFHVNSKGVAGPGTAHDSTTPFPFAFAFDSRGHAVMAQLNQLNPPVPGTAATYSVTRSGATTPLDRGETSRGADPCWVQITANGRYAYLANVGGGATSTPTPGASIAEYKLSPSGRLTLLGNTRPLREFLKTNELLSSDNKYLYVLSPWEANPGGITSSGNNSHIDEYAVRPNGTLRLIGVTHNIPLAGLSGLAGT